MDAAEKWGLPPAFQPVRYGIPDAAKEAARTLLAPNEPVIISIGNEGDSIAIVATPFRVMAIKSAEMGAGVGGVAVKQFPWEGIFGITLRPQTLNVTLALTSRTLDNGRTAEVGRRAMMGKEKVDVYMAFEMIGGEEVYVALLQVWNWKRAQAQAAKAAEQESQY